MKNVTGLDLVKTQLRRVTARSASSLEATFKLLPRRETEATIVVRRLDDDSARRGDVARARLALRRQRRRDDRTPAWVAIFRARCCASKASPNSVAYRIERLIALLAEFGAKHALHGEESRSAVARGPRRRIPRRAARARGLARQRQAFAGAATSSRASARPRSPRCSTGAAASSGSRREPTRSARRRRCARALAPPRRPRDADARAAMRSRAASTCSSRRRRRSRG